MSIKNIYQALRSAEVMRKKLRDRRDALLVMRKQLQRQGIVRGSLHQQEKRPGYFVWYLNVASVDCKPGKRERRYVGPGDEKCPAVVEVKEQIKRAAKFDELGRELAAVESAIGKYCRMLRGATATTEYEIKRW